MLTVFLRFFRDKSRTLIFFSLGGILLIGLYISFYPIIQHQQANIMAFMENIPTGLLKLFGAEDINFFTIEGFLTLKHYNITLPVMIIFLLTSLAGTGLSGAVDKGTMEIPLSCPISRIRYFFGIYLTGIVALIIFIACTFLMISPLAEINGVEYIFKYHALIAIDSLFFGWAILSLAMLLSSIFSEPRSTYMILGSTFFAMYILFILPGFVSSLGWMQYFSLFHYFDPNHILLSGGISFTSVLVFSLTALLSTLAGVLRFNSRDIAV